MVKAGQSQQGLLITKLKHGDIFKIPFIHENGVLLRECTNSDKFAVGKKNTHTQLESGHKTNS